MGKAEKFKEIKKQKENEPESASLLDIYRLADPVDYQVAIRREEFRLNRSSELLRLSDLGLSPNESNIALWGKRQKEIDKSFQDSATPVFYAMLTLSVATFCAAFIQRLVWEISAIRQVFRAKKAYIRKLLHMDIAWLESRHSGQVASVLNDQADCIYQGMADHLPIICYMAVTISVCLYIHWQVTAFILLAIPLLICTRLVFSRWFCKTMETETQLQTKITNLVHETFSCIRTVIAFGAQRQSIGKYERLSLEHKKITEERLRASSVYNSLAQ
uniref:ABC transmembrane type-1 domain-containing protein n=1 Tax=Meloidogyne javanica TaxID=6303 RepID=A0A915LSM4_MELJA